MAIKCSREILEEILAELGGDKTRVAAINTICWEDGETSGTFLGYARIGDDGDFVDFVVISGDAMPITGTVVSCSPVAANVVKEHYLCIGGIKTPVWVSLDPNTLEIYRVLNTLDLTIVDPADYAGGFQDPCEDCV